MLPVRIFIGVLLFVVLLIVAQPFLEKATHGNWNKTFTTLTTGGATHAFVHGYTDNPIAGWTAQLIWDKGNDKWFVYYLSHDAYFEKYELRWRDVNIEVIGNGALLGTLDTKTGTFFHRGQNYLYKEPVAVIHGTNLDDQEKWTYWANPDGTMAQQ